MNPLAVSIIIPTYNRVEWLKETLVSLQSQTFNSWEALIVDDGSDEETIEAILSASESDARIQYLKRTGAVSGAPACRNEGLDKSQGKYVIFLDSDDNLSPSALADRVDIMDNHPELDFGVFSCLLFQNHPGDMDILWNIDKDEDDIDRFLAQDVPWQTTSPIWRRESLVKLGPWQESLPSWQDWEFHLRALIIGLSYKRFSQIDHYWRCPAKKSASIGRASKSIEHLKSHSNLIIEIQNQLLEKNQLTAKRKKLISGIAFWIMDQCLTQHDKKSEAFSIWQKFYEQGVINKILYLQGISYLYAITLKMPHGLINRTLRKLTLMSMSLMWSKTVLVPYYLENTLHKVPRSA